MVQLEWMKLGKQPDGSRKFKTIPGFSQSGLVEHKNGYILDDIALMTRDQQKRTIPVNAQVHLDAMIKKLYPNAAKFL